MLDRLMSSLGAFVGAFADSTPGGSVLDLGGVTAGFVPAMPDRSVVNSVVYDDARALEAQLPRLASAYDDAGVSAWTVWVHEEDSAATSAVRAAGHVFDAEPMGQVRELDGVEPPDDGALDVDRDPEPGAIASVIAEAYGWPNARDAIVAWPDGYHPYLARADGEPACCLAVHDHDGDAHVTLVGTLERARGRGLATGLMQLALADARERGCTTTSLVATKMGYPLYRRLGYRDFGRVNMWERRKPA